MQASWDRADGDTLLRLSILWMLRDGTERGKWSIFRLLLLIGNVLKMDSKTKPTSKLNWRVINNLYLQIRTRVQKETSFRHFLEPLRAMNEHDETALAAFRFLYSTSTKNLDAYSLHTPWAVEIHWSLLHFGTFIHWFAQRSFFTHTQTKLTREARSVTTYLC